EAAREHEELLAAAMGMLAESRIRGVAHDGRGARDLVADPVQHPALDAGHRRRPPRLVLGTHHFAPAKICSQLHGAYLSAWRGRDHALRPRLDVARWMAVSRAPVELLRDEGGMALYAAR